MAESTNPLTVAFILASYRDHAPAGMERATAGLATGLRQLGHRALIITAAPPVSPGADLITLELPGLVFPCSDETLHRTIDAEQERISEALDSTFERFGVDVAVYVDALWGFGRIARRGHVRSVLAMHVVGHDDDLEPALARADLVMAPSPTVLAEGVSRGYLTENWRIVPNGLLYDRDPTPEQRRAAVRARGPIRILSRLGLEKNVRGLLEAGRLVHRPVEVVTASAGFEIAEGAQLDELNRCRYTAAHMPLCTLKGSGLPWNDVLPWLAEAAVVIVPSIRETFGLVALEAMSVGTPVVAFDVGNLPALIGTSADAGGVIVPLSSGAHGLWRAAELLLEDPVRYADLSRAAYYRSRDYLPTTVAETFVKAVR